MALEPNNANAKPPRVDLLLRVSDFLFRVSEHVRRFRPTKTAAMAMGVWSVAVMSATQALLAGQAPSTRFDIFIVVAFFLVLVPVFLVVLDLRPRPFSVATFKEQFVLGLFWLLGCLVVPVLVGLATLLFRLVMVILG